SLVKTAIFGEDANWGRIIAAMGYSGGNFNPDCVSINFANQTEKIDLLMNGVPIAFDEEKALKILQHKEITFNITLNDGNSSATAWGCDLSYDYIKINGDYRT
ncbi:MAG: bifunctional ornithine acetyltransferase/N-acetylglutamate synthase, partial [Candidatus Heimdallarchaeota archaeon]|nr:bifunctional ornithine acetyltransferase/N-acetylglutamate synthase [Candidatus Heimdallarchaeota archaeon]